MNPAARVPRVGMGLPVYNGQRYLAEALDSVLAQTYADFELVITDNASTDRTPEICRDYARRDPRVRYHRNPHNVGVSGNFNRAFQLCRGELFRWQAYDDLMAPDFLRATVAALDADPSLAIVHSQTGEIDGQGRRLGVFQAKLLLDAPQAHRRFRAMLWTDTFPAIFGLMRSRHARRTRLFGPLPGADRVFLAELLLLGRLAYLPETLFYIRVHPEAYRLAADTLEKQLQWYDPTRKMPPWLQLPYTARTFAAAALRVPAPRLQKARALGHVAAWTAHGLGLLVARRLRGAGRAIGRAARRVTGRGPAPQPANRPSGMRP